MSELKDYDIMDIEAMDDERLEKSESGKIQATRVYIKSEADKVIAELKADYKEACDRLQKANLIKDEQLAATRHSKYTRCHDNAWRCRKLSNVYALIAYTHRGWKIAGYYDDKAELYRKWNTRWLKIAEQFKDKEAKK